MDIKILVIETNERRAGERAQQVSSLGYGVIGQSGMPGVDVEFPDDISVVMVWSGLLRGTGIDRLRKLMERHADSSVIFMVDSGDRIGTLNDVVEGIYDYIVIPSSDLYMKHVIDVAVDRRARFLLEKYYQSYLEEQVTEQLQNISDQQMRLLHSDRLSSIGQVAAGIIHELNNPLTYMKLNLQTMDLIQEKLREIIRDGHGGQKNEQDKTSDNGGVSDLFEESKNMLGTVQKGVEQIQNILANIRQFSRKPEKTAIEFDIAQAISNALNFAKFMLKKNIKIKKEFAQGIPPLVGDPSKLEQVLLNLLINAVHAVEDRKGGELVIKTSMMDDQGKRFAEVKFSDNGPGIPASIINKIFDPFFTTKSKEKGTGLGLSISAEIMEEFSGKLAVESVEGAGATFTLLLPIKTDRKKEPF
ncbi:MAG: sensor histidine kinase [Nitrospinota bacterium]